MNFAGNTVQCKVIGGNGLTNIDLTAGQNSATSGNVFPAGAYTVIATASVQGTDYNTVTNAPVTTTIVNSNQAVTVQLSV